VEVPEPPRETGSDRPRFIRFDAHHDLRAGGGHESQLARLTAVPVDDSRLPRTNSRDPQPRSRRQDICVGVRLVGSPAGSPPAPCTTRTRRRGCRTRCGSAGHSANPYRHCHTTCASGPLPAAQAVSVRHAVHRRAAWISAAGGAGVGRCTAAGRGHLPGGLITGTH
jgi:hypothetical protein